MRFVQFKEDLKEFVDFLGFVAHMMGKQPLRYLKGVPKAMVASHRLRRNEKRTKEELYKNKDFLLVRVVKEAVDENDGGTSLSVVCPASDHSIVSDIEKQGGYYCMSHVWGPPDQWEEWSDSGVIDLQGNPATVKIRREKQAKFLRLFKEFGGYWWIDIFCAQHDTPLDIMGDIYRQSKRTYALLDCPVDTFTPVSNLNVYEEYIAVSYTHHYEITKTYLGELEKLGPAVPSGEMTWHQTLDLILGWWCMGSEDKRDCMHVIADIMSCNWFGRVWTLQEAILPNNLSFVLEIDDPDCSIVDVNVMSSILGMAGSIISIARMTLNYQPEDIQGPYIQEWLTKNSRLLEGKAFILSNNRRGSDKVLEQFFLDDAYFSVGILYLSLDKRICLDPCDYVYGVIGYLEVKLPRMHEPSKVWQAFLDEIEPRLPKDAQLPRSFDLASAKDMASVYSSFQPKRLLELTGAWKHVTEIYDIPDNM